MSFSAKIIHRTDAIRRDGTAALGLQVIIHRKRKVFPLKIWVKPGEVDTKAPSIRLRRRGKQWRELEQNYNSIMLNHLSRALNVIAKAQAMQQPIDIERFTHLFSNAKLNKDFITYIEDAIEKERGLLAPGTTKDNEKVLKRLRRWRSRLDFSELNVSTVKEFQKNMQAWGLGVNTIASTHKGIRKFINLAKQDYPALPNPYKKFKIRWAEADRDFLTPAELRRMLDAYNTPGQLAGAMRRAARCFLFQSFTGLRVGDAMALTYDNWVGDYIVFTAEKTRRYKLSRKVRLNRIAKKLIEDAHAEYGGKRQLGSLMHFYDDTNVYNRTLRSLAAFLDIKKKITSHVGRHTFATNYLLSGGKVERLMKLLGHTALETTMVYVHLVEEFQDQDMEGLAKFFITEAS